MKIPNRAACRQLMSDMVMMDHIKDHSEQVCRVACHIVDGFRQKGITLKRDLIQAAALLHDITKTRSFNTGENHAQTGGRLIEEMGYAEVGAIVRQHVVLDVYDDTGVPREAEIVNYADKRVLHDEIVSLRIRMDYILQRYGETPADRERILGLWNKTKGLEEKLFSILPFMPEELLIDLEHSIR